MGATRDFVAATFADALLPTFRRPVEDIIYETLDSRQIPTRTDFKEMRDLLNNLRGQVSGTAGGVRKIVERSEDAEETLAQLEARLDQVEAAHRALLQKLADADAVADRLARLEARLDDALSTEQVDARIAAAVAALPAPPAPADISAAEVAAQLDALRAELQQVPAPAPAPAPAAEPTPDAVGDTVAPEPEICKIEGCGGEGRARGFCARHYQRWRRGSLKKEYVSLEGDVQLDGKKRQIDARHAGDPYTVVDGQVIIDGAAVALEG